MSNYQIALYPGDGIGPDVTIEAVRAVKAAEGREGFRCFFTEFDWGSRFWRKTGKVAPEDFLETLKKFDAIFLGAVGDPFILPDHVTLEPLIRMRQAFDQYACVRPAALLPGVKSPLVNGEADIVVVRENSEGEYVNFGGFFRPETKDEIAVQTSVHTKTGVTRLLKYAFELAGKRRRKLTMATKSNALAWGMQLWDKAFQELAAGYPGVQSEKIHIDALAMRFVRCPGSMDVVAGSNLFGDILSDLAGAITGSIGLAPSANINPERNFPSLFEPVHGSAPDIAGKGIANPVGAIRSAAMMLGFLGERKAEEAIERAVSAVLAAGSRLTPDLGGSASTHELGSEISLRIAEDSGE